MSAPGDGGYYNNTGRSWCATRSPAPEQLPATIRHADGCVFAPWPNLARICPCNRPTAARP